MSTILKIDRLKRLTISIYFRCFIICYAVFILLISTNTFSWYINSGLFIAYIILFTLLHGKDSILSSIRLINDYLFIFLILYQYKENDIYFLSLVFAPILNSQNYSGEKRSLLLYIIPIIIIYILADSFSIYITIPFLLFFAINSTAQKRVRYIQFYEKLSAIIDDFFTRSDDAAHPHRIYKSCIPILNSKPLFLQIKEIYCFKLSNDSITIFNGSQFIWNHTISKKSINKIASSFKNSPETFLTIPNIHININNKQYHNNMVIAYKFPDNTIYVFFLISDYLSMSFNLCSLDTNSLLKPFFIKLAQAFEGNLQQHRIETKALQDLKAKLSYVNAAVKSMHFIRNKLGPVKNYLSMADDYDKSDDDKKQKIAPYLNREREKVRSSLMLVLNQADFILEKSNNPFIINALTPHSIQELFTQIRYLLLEYNLTENFIVQIADMDVDKKILISYNKTGLDLILTNWIANMDKYNTGEYGVTLEETENTIKIEFRNSFDSNKPESTEFIKQFNSEDRLEINKRKSHGLSELKELLTQMNLSNKLISKDNFVYFIIEFVKLENYEKDSNI